MKLWKNPQFKENGYQVRGYSASHHKDEICTHCKEFKEVATIWYRTRQDDIDFDYRNICKECAVKVGYEVVS